MTAIDVSPVALQRGADHAAAVGAEVAKRIDWQQQDAQVWGPEPSSFDLVNAQFMHLPPAPRGALFGRLADGVAPGGTLLIVGHHPSDLETTVPRGSNPDLLFTASEVAALLDSESGRSSSRRHPSAPSRIPMTTSSPSATRSCLPAGASSVPSMAKTRPADEPVEERVRRRLRNCARSGA